MATSDSEDFESADEGQNTPIKKDRKERLSSSNYTENSRELDHKTKKTQSSSTDTVKNKEEPKSSDGWDDFDIDDDEILVAQNAVPSNTHVLQSNKNETIDSNYSQDKTTKKSEETKSKDTGWDDFDDWGQDDNTIEDPYKPIQTQPTRQETKSIYPDIQEVTEKLANTTTTSTTGGWGWGWSVDSILTTATAGISTLTNQVSQGISTVLETSIGAPDPEELARQTAKEREAKANSPDGLESNINTNNDKVDPKSTSDAFPFRGLISEVTKFVETTGTKVISGGLGTLETIGKKTMEVLQDGDPGLAKKRALLGLAPDEKPVLSQILREAKAKADEDDRIREEKKEAKEVHYENLFDDFEGLVHLEALEMLSRQVNMRIEERMRGLSPEKRQDLKETLQQVAELCEMPEDDEDDNDPSEDTFKSEAFHERLQTATQDLGLKLQFQPIVKQYTEAIDWLSSGGELTEKQVYKRAVASLAQATALSVELYHKAGEMLLVKPRRSTADEADALTQMTAVLTKHVSELATLFTEKLNELQTENTEQIHNYITNIFLEAGNSSTYIQNAFQLALPILQIGAV